MLRKSKLQKVNYKKGKIITRFLNQTNHILTPSKASNQGFTLIEIIVVIGIISIMAAVVLTILDPLAQFQKAQDTKRKSDLAQVQRGLESYYQDYHRYPQASSSNEIAPDGTAIDWGTSWQPYMDVLPIDPTTSKHYVYWVDNTGQSYAVYASLDRGGKDSQACNGGASCSNVPANVYCGSSSSYICNYGVSSPNISP